MVRAAAIFWYQTHSTSVLLGHHEAIQRIQTAGGRAGDLRVVGELRGHGRGDVLQVSRGAVGEHAM